MKKNQILNSMFVTLIEIKQTMTNYLTDLRPTSYNIIGNRIFYLINSVNYLIQIISLNSNDIWHVPKSLDLVES